MEDCRDVQEFVSYLLTSFGYETASVSNRDNALACMAGFVPELLLMDYSMPGMHLDDFIFNVHAEFPNTRIVLYSAENAAEKARAHGIKYYVAKPFQIRMLEEILENCLSGGKSSLVPAVQVPIAA